MIRYDYFDVNKLNDIEKQVHLLNLSQAIMFCILKSGIQATRFYWDNSILGYSTSYLPKVELREYRSNQFDEYLQNNKNPNYSWHGMYISGFDALDTYLIVQHNDPLSDNEIRTINYLVDVANQRYKTDLEIINQTTKKITDTQ